MVFTVLWVGWLVYFLVVEAIAIVHSARSTGANPRDTLSEHVWWWFGTAPGSEPNTWAYVRRFALLAFMAWLSVHFLGGGQYV